MPKKKVPNGKSNPAPIEYIAEEVNLSPIKKAEPVKKTIKKKPVKAAKAAPSKKPAKKPAKAKAAADPAKVAAAKKNLTASIAKREKSVQQAIVMLNTRKAGLKTAQMKLRKLK